MYIRERVIETVERIKSVGLLQIRKQNMIISNQTLIGVWIAVFVRWQKQVFKDSWVNI